MDVWQQITEDARTKVQHETWGHLGPTEGKHHGQMIVAFSTYGDIVVVDDSFPTLQNSPWQFGAINDAAFESVKDEDVGVYSLVGWIEWGAPEDEPEALTMVDYELELTPLIPAYEPD